MKRTFRITLLLAMLVCLLPNPLISNDFPGDSPGIYPATPPNRDSFSLKQKELAFYKTGQSDPSFMMIICERVKAPAHWLSIHFVRKNKGLEILNSKNDSKPRAAIPSYLRACLPRRQGGHPLDKGLKPRFTSFQFVSQTEMRGWKPWIGNRTKTQGRYPLMPLPKASQGKGLPASPARFAVAKARRARRASLSSLR